MRLKKESDVMMARNWKTICCSVDFSEPTRAALSVAADPCSRLGAPNVALQRVKGQAEIAIVDHAARSGVDLVVMGTHGRTDREKMLAGSVTESVVRNAGCPVLTVHPRDVS